MDFMHDSRVSFPEKAILMYALQKTDVTHISLSDIMEVSKESESEILDYLEKIISNGYAVKKTNSNDPIFIFYREAIE